MTQHELADAVGMPQPSIARIERGAVLPRTTTLLAILDATGHRLAVEPREPPPKELADIRRRLAMAVPKRTAQALGPRSRRDRQRDPVRIVSALRRRNVQFVLIGDLAEIAHGAPIAFRGVVDVCHAQTEVASRRLGLALEDLGAKGSRDGVLRTDAGRLRLLTETAAGDDYEVLARNAAPMQIEAGIQVQVAALEDLARAHRAEAGADSPARAALLHTISGG